ncbi:hypothetical protein FQN54_007037 [Arachnomyces sp. PD_36]|nr:hypothetical protein FQN54_007037 [Arachnomyces sp. PD_36]
MDKPLTAIAGLNAGSHMFYRSPESSFSPPEKPTHRIRMPFTRRSSSQTGRFPASSNGVGMLSCPKVFVVAKVMDHFYENVRNSTYGLVFFETPHHGGNGASTAKVVANVISVFAGDLRSNLLPGLKSNSLLNEATSDGFRAQLANYKVISFFEMRQRALRVRGWRVLPTLIVNRVCAKLGSPNERVLGIDADHSNMCKFSSEEDANFLLVARHIRDLANEAAANLSNESHSDGPQIAYAPGSTQSQSNNTADQHTSATELNPHQRQSLSNLQSTLIMADLCRDQNRYSEAEEMYRKALEQEKYAEAETFCRRALAVEETSADALQTLGILGLVLCKQEKHSESESVNRRCLEMSREFNGPESPDTLHRYQILARALQDAKELRDAELLLREAEEIGERVLGLQHSQTLDMKYILVNVLRGQRKYAEAESRCRNLLDLTTEQASETDGRGRNRYLDNRSLLARILQDKGGNTTEAVNLRREILEKKETILGPEHPSFHPGNFKRPCELPGENKKSTRPLKRYISGSST